jgi:uncharacterized protein (TIGR03437 family)
VKVKISAGVLSGQLPVSILPDTFTFPINRNQTGTIHRRGFVRGSTGRYSFQFNRSSLGLVLPPPGTVSPNGLSLFDLAFNLDQLPARTDFTDTLLVKSDAGTASAPVVVSNLPDHAFLRPFASRLFFPILAGSTSSQFGQFTIFNLGPPGNAINFVSSILSGSPRFFSFGNASNPQNGSGSVTPEKPFVLPFLLTPPAQPGLDSALITVTDPANPFSSTPFVISQLSDPTVLPLFDLAPAATVFPPPPGLTPRTKTFTFSTTGPATTFIVGTSTASGGNWLSVSPTGGSISNFSTQTLTITENPSAVPSGGDVGFINVRAGSRSLTHVVIDISGFFIPSADRLRGAAACVPTRVVIAPVGLASGFSRTQGFPDGLSAEIYDDCGNALTGPENTVVAVFDNGDPTVVLENFGVGAGQAGYLGAWTPLTAQANTTVTFVGASGNLKPGTVAVSGTVTASQLNLPVLVRNGTVNNTNPLGGPVLAPGMVTSIYGLNLASSPASPGLIPLPNTFNGTSVLIGGKPAPFYFASPGQLNVQAPTNLVPGEPTSVSVQVNSAFAVLPGTVSVFAGAPGVSAFADGHIIAQHADFSLVDAAHPAKPGEALVMYLSGMGATTPSVATGLQASATSLTPAQTQPVVTIGGQNAPIAYAGLTPGGIGLYQINFTVPVGLAAGDSPVVVTQSGVAANQTLLPVGAP